MNPRIFLCLFALTGCQRPAAIVEKPLAENVLAQVGPEVITIEDFQQAMQRRPIGQSEAARTALLDELIQFRALVQEAKVRGYDRDPEFLASVERMLASKVRSEDEQARAAQSEVTPEEIENHYQEHQKSFTVPAKFRAAMIFVEAPATFSEEKRAERRASIEAARAKAATDPEQFRALAVEYSYDQPTKHRGGDLGYMVEGQTGSDALANAAALREPGELSEIITAPDGFRLFKLIERHPGTVRPLETVRDVIRSQLPRQKQSQSKKAVAASILSGRKVEVHHQRLASIPRNASGPDAQSAIPPSLPAAP